jgi:ABC-type Fe3+-hydroxamate transport system substrate-binding protein
MSGRMLASALIGLALALSLGACGRSPTGGSNPGEAARGPGDRETDARLAVLSPALGATLMELGLGDLVVAKHDYDLALGDDVPAVGHNEAIDYEALLGAEPTHVLIEESRAGVPARLIEIAGERGWTVRTFALRSIDDVAQSADDLALSFGAVDFDAATNPGPSGVPGMDRFQDPGNRLGRELPSASLARALAPIEDADRAGTVLLLGSVDPPAALGPGSFHHDILTRLGASPAVPEGLPWMELDAEDVLRMAPNAIVVVAPRAVGSPAGETGAAATLDRLGAIGRLPIPAVEGGRLVTVDDPLALLPSLSMVGFATELGEVLERWAE